MLTLNEKNAIDSLLEDKKRAKLELLRQKYNKSKREEIYKDFSKFQRRQLDTLPEF